MKMIEFNVIKLKDCPFCGKKGKLIRLLKDYSTNPPMIKDRWIATCESGCVQTNAFTDKIYREDNGFLVVESDGVEQAIEAWNKRV